MANPQVIVCLIPFSRLIVMLFSKNEQKNLEWQQLIIIFADRQGAYA